MYIEREGERERERDTELLLNISCVGVFVVPCYVNLCVIVYYLLFSFEKEID